MTDPNATPRAFTARGLHGRPFPLHVLALPAVPVMALWAGNAPLVRTLLPMQIAAWSAGSAVVLAAIISIVQRDVRRSALIASMLVFGFSVHGHVFTPGNSLALPAAGLAAAGIIIVAIRLGSRALATLTLVVNVVSAALLIANSALIIANRPGTGAAATSEPAQAVPASPGPDVWYIAPDRYPDLDLLEDRGVNTRGFQEELVDRGFTVLSDAYANYPVTQHSLASAWSGQLLGVTRDGHLEVDANHILLDPPIGRLFLDAGYTYFHLGTWFDATSSSQSASSVMTLQLGQEFYGAYEQTTLIPSLRSVMPIGRAYADTFNERQYRHAQHQLEVMRQLAARSPVGPEFLLVHITLPHPTYVFDEHGNLQSDTWPEEGRQDAYEAQLAYFNAQLLEIFDLLLQRPEPPLIVLLPDEGVYPEDVDDVSQSDYDLGRLTPTQIREKMSIVATIYDPDPDQRPNHPPGTTAVNVVRTMLNRVLGTDQAREPDIAYIWQRVGDELVLVPADL